MAIALSLEQLPHLLSELPGRVNEAIARAAESVASRGMAEAKKQIGSAEPFPAVNTGALRQSVAVKSTQSKTVWLVIAQTPYAAVMEWGARPFKPPFAPIYMWALRKYRKAARRRRRGTAATGKKSQENAAVTAIAWKVIAKIKRHGIAPRHYMAKTAHKMRTKFVNVEVRRALKALATKPARPRGRKPRGRKPRGRKP